MIFNFSAMRERFLNSAIAAGASVHEYHHPLRGPCGEMLATDVALLGDRNAKRYQVILSGVHGIEGYYGSDSQTRWLHDLADQPLPDDVAILMIHLINPWGTAWNRRVNENNIDLNRNFLTFDHALPKNNDYMALHEIYACRQLHGAERLRADRLLADQVNTHGWRSVMSIVEAGQYGFADGLYYGGQAPTWSNRILHEILHDYLSHARVASIFDLHTGAGDYGHPMLMSIAEAAHAGLTDAQTLYGPWLYTLLTGAGNRSDTGVAATATGYTSQALLRALGHLHLMPYVIECGTYPGAQIHTHLRNDHWLHLHGDPNDSTGQQIKRSLLEQFYPDDPDWREVVWLRTKQIWSRTLFALPNLEIAA